jgi:hypothetical protein
LHTWFNVKKSKEQSRYEKQNTRVKEFLYFMEHTRAISAWQHNDELRVDALVVPVDRVGAANGTFIHLLIRSVYPDEHFRRSAIRQVEQEKDDVSL